MKRILDLIALAVIALAFGCTGPDGLHPAPAADTTVKFDFHAKPLPEIPLPNDIATRYDADSATGRRINASLIAPTRVEQEVRTLIDELDGWGVSQAITIPFTGPIDPLSLIAGHRDADYDFGNDVIYLIDVTRGSPTFGQAQPLDVGNGNFPPILENPNGYWGNDPRRNTLSLFFEETDEDLNFNGRLDPGEDLDGDGEIDPGEDVNNNGRLDPPEDTDADGVLDTPNYLPGTDPQTPAERADALMTFYEAESHTVIVRPLIPLRERTTYAVVVTRRLKDAAGQPVGSPFEWINHIGQNEALAALPSVLPASIGLDDVAFAFSFTTQSTSSYWLAVREGLYGHGVQGHIGREYPPEVHTVAPVRDPAVFDTDNPHILPAEDFTDSLSLVATALLEQDANSQQYAQLLNSYGYVDFLAAMRFESPQLFARTDDEGNLLGLNQQSWPVDLDRVPAETRSETIHAILVVPRKEVSVREHGAPAPVVLVGHGYSSSRFEALMFAGYFARFGFATLGIDCVSHGLPVGETEKTLAQTILGGRGLGPLVDALFQDRGTDQNADGVVDSGGDFWTSYVFHTRDVVRQCALDHMQIVRILRQFDGVQPWFDLDGDGMPELAGDFDADGQIDIGGDTPIGVFGASLGGIVAALMGSLEPEVDFIAPLSAGAGLGDVGIRSVQGTVKNAVILRVLAPIVLGTINDAGEAVIEQLVPDVNDDARRPVGSIPGARPWDTLLVSNETTGEHACAYLDAEGRGRAHVPSDLGDSWTITLYAGPQIDPAAEEPCTIRDGAIERGTITEFAQRIDFQGETIEAGSPLVALAEGFGEQRATPGLRRFMGLGQLVLDGGDPSTFMRHLQQEPLTYPSTGDRTGAHAMVVTTIGDMTVPTSAGITLARAAGIIDWRTPDPRYGVPHNQVLIDTHTTEAAHPIGRHFDPDGAPVHMDVDNFSEDDDLWAGRLPRLNPPLRIGLDRKDPLGGVSGALFPLSTPTGEHGIAFPGGHIDKFLERCEDPEGCPTGYDVGNFMLGLLGGWFATLGDGPVRLDPCLSRDDCPGSPAVPPAR